MANLWPSTTLELGLRLQGVCRWLGRGGSSRHLHCCAGERLPGQQHPAGLSSAFGKISVGSSPRGRARDEKDQEAVEGPDAKPAIEKSPRYPPWRARGRLGDVSLR